MAQHRPHHFYHRHRHRHRMEIVLENPSVSPIATAATTTKQLGLSTHLPHHFPHRATYDADLGHNPSLLPEDYYARNRHALTVYGNVDGAPAPVTVRRIDKSGLLEITETNPVTCPRPCVLTGAEDVAARAASLRIDRSGLLEAVPEAVDQLEEHNGGMLDEAAGISRRETLKDADVNPHVFEGGYLLERPSSLEGQACLDEADVRAHSADLKVLNESPRAQFDVSNATERLPHLPFSPGPSLRRFRNDPSKRSPLTSRCVDADSARGLRNKKSPEFTAKYTAVNSASKNPADPSQSPITLERSQIGCAKKNVDPASVDSDIQAVDAIKMPRESLLARGAAKREDDSPGEERAEAEGCEHTTVESLEEDKVSFKGSNKLPDNDNVQTLRVIILSEQL